MHFRNLEVVASPLSCSFSLGSKIIKCTLAIWLLAGQTCIDRPDYVVVENSALKKMLEQIKCILSRVESNQMHFSNVAFRWAKTQAQPIMIFRFGRKSYMHSRKWLSLAVSKMSQGAFMHPRDAT